MKVQRYLYGQSNISQLESKRSNLIKSDEAARFAAAPYEAVAGAAQNISSDLFRLAERNQQLRKKEDAIVAKIAEEQVKAKTFEWQNNSAYMDQLQENGTPTASVMLTEFENILNLGKEQLQNIQDPETRATAERLFDISSQTARIKARNFVDEKRAAWNAKGMFDLRAIQYEAQDWAGFRETNQQMLDEDLISQEQYARAEEEAVATRKTVEVQNILKDYDQRIAAGEGEEVLTEVLAKPNKDPKMQDMIVAGVKAQTYNYKLTQQKEEDALVAGWMRETDNLLNSIHNEGATINVDSLFETMVGSGLDMVKAATLTNQVSAAMRSRAVKDDGYSEFKARISMNEPVDNNAGNREHADRYVAAQLETRPNERPIDVVIETYKAIGLVGQQWQTRLESANSAEGMAQSAEFWSALHADPYRQVEDGLSPERRGIYEMIKRRAKDGAMSWIDATRDVMDITKMDETRRELRKAQWEKDDDGIKFAEKYYGKLMDSNAYDKSLIPFYGGVDNIDDEMNLAHYRMYLQDGYVIAGNWPDAQAHADQVFKKSHVLTNINGDLEMQVGGIPMDLNNGSQVNLSDLRTQFVSEISGKQMMFTDADGSTRIGTIDSPEGLTLDDPKEILGEWVYKVSMNGNRIINPETGNQLEVSFDGMDIYKLQVKQAVAFSEKQFRESQAQIQKDIISLDEELKFFSQGNQSSPEIQKIIQDKKTQKQRREQLMMEKERQRKIEVQGQPQF